MKNKAYISAIISAFAVFGFVLFLVITTVKDKYLAPTSDLDEIVAVSSVDVGSAKRSGVSNADASSEGVPNIDIPDLVIERRRISPSSYNSPSGSSQVVITPAPSYNVSGGNNRSSDGATMPNSSTGVTGGGGQFSGGAAGAPMFSGALTTNSRDDQKPKTSGFVSTTFDLTNPRVLTGQKLNNNNDSPPPEEKDPIVFGSLPIGDGWSFLILLSLIYVGFKKWLF